MKGWTRKTWIGCVVALALGAPLAHADGGTITFSGAVVTPTCSMGGSDSAPATQGMAHTSRTRFGCSGTADASFSAKAPQAYTVSVESLESSSLGADRLVSYFSGYVRASVPGDVHMQLVTQAYD
ncbi:MULTISPECIES: type 1 fimbrial protein [unclassified Dyella]|uniref:type 1 fimbrial protein n=1 Tax=unclassified Dyella TaxID=2634549 RepID=UPI000C814EDD|nr:MULTISPECIES: type 1 fimbrial protein [unclassified Dyella]MDR3444856.1 type 1 fimbrial protein [Dyella sp.]PMQ07337.1 hypothetical protein DyAD56_01050 [Dyella sp. AD56]